MDSLDYFKLAGQLPSLKPGDFKQQVKISLVTNFTDDILAKLLAGSLLAEDLYPQIYKAPYKQYAFSFKDKTSALNTAKPNLTFIFFDISQYLPSELLAGNGQEFYGLLKEIESYAQSQNGPVVMNNFILPYNSAYSNMLGENPLYAQIQKFNSALDELAAKLSNFYVFHTNRLIHTLGETRSRDFRGMYAFDTPFTLEFLMELVKQWQNYVSAAIGGVKKCLVLDLDNVLWGGILGEAGIEGVALGLGYPGMAFQNFQKALLDYYNRGVLLAINSRNNEADVREMFSKHPHMVLQPHHFAATRINWKDKAENLVSLAEELNLGLDSLVFLDDDPLNRELVKARLGQVLVPEFSLSPEHYAKTLFGLAVFMPFKLTEEDKRKGQMYAQEKQRTEVLAQSGSLQDYIKQLDIRLNIHTNNQSQIPRLSQMALKTNQFNLTTKRYSEKDIKDLMQNGKVLAVNVTDKFGDYGITALAILTDGITKPKTAILDSYMLSCRVFGRGIEYSLLQHLAQELAAAGYRQLEIRFSPTAKNQPAREFLENLRLLPDKQPEKESVLLADIKILLSLLEQKVQSINVVKEL